MQSRSKALLFPFIHFLNKIGSKEELENIEDLYVTRKDFLVKVDADAA